MKWLNHVESKEDEKHIRHLFQEAGNTGQAGRWHISSSMQHLVSKKSTTTKSIMAVWITKRRTTKSIMAKSKKTVLRMAISTTRQRNRSKSANFSQKSIAKMSCILQNHWNISTGADNENNKE